MVLLRAEKKSLSIFSHHFSQFSKMLITKNPNVPKSPMELYIPGDNPASLNCLHVVPDVDGATGGCDFPWQNVNKVAWRPLVVGAPYIYDLLKDVTFASSKMEGIMYSYYFSRLNMAEFACEWVQRNSGTWEPWIPSGKSIPMSVSRPLCRHLAFRRLPILTK